MPCRGGQGGTRRSRLGGFEIVEVARFALESDEAVAHMVKNSCREGEPGGTSDVGAQKVKTGLFIPTRPIVEK